MPMDLVVSGFIVVEPKTTRSIGITYELPNAAVQSTDGVWRYDLKIRRQPGTGSPRVSVKIKLPDDSCVVGSDPDLSVSPDGLLYSFDLNADRTITIWYGTDAETCTAQAA